MKKRLILLACSFTLGLGAILYWGVFAKRSTPLQQNRFYASFPITKFSSSHIPYLDIEIEEKNISVQLDLGFNSSFSLKEELISELREKSFLDTRTFYRANGHGQKENIYTIPQLKIRNLTFSNLRLKQENETVHQEGLSWGEKPDSPVGKLGWTLFQNTVLLLDLGNSSLTVCDSLETLKNQGHSLEGFFQAPLLLERNVIEFEVVTSKSILRCMLDSGCTLNLLNTPLPEGKSLEEVMFKEENKISFSTFQIGNKDFGPVIFRPYPLKLPFHVDAIVGMDFLFDHRVVIDFPSKHLYFAKEAPAEPRSR